MTVNVEFTLSAYPNGLNEAGIIRLAIQARNAIHDLSTRTPEFTDEDRKHRRLTITCDPQSNKALANNLYTMLQAEGLGGRRKGRRINIVAYDQKSGDRIPLEILE